MRAASRHNAPLYRRVLRLHISELSQETDLSPSEPAIPPSIVLWSLVLVGLLFFLLSVY